MVEIFCMHLDTWHFGTRWLVESLACGSACYIPLSFYCCLKYLTTVGDRSPGVASRESTPLIHSQHNKTWVNTHMKMRYKCPYFVIKSRMFIRDCILLLSWRSNDAYDLRSARENVVWELDWYMQRHQIFWHFQHSFFPDYFYSYTILSCVSRCCILNLLQCIALRADV